MHRFNLAKVFAVIAILLASFGFVGGNASADVPRGAVYTLTNQAAGNAVAAFDRAPDGTLTPAGMYPTGGIGTGAGLGSQNALIATPNYKWLFAVNAGSNDISVFAIEPVGLTLVDRVPSGGVQPISLTLHKDLLYVLNAGGSGSITAFNVMGDGTLAPVSNSTRPLGAGTAGPAEVQFSPNGRLLVVTEKASNTIDTYVVGKDGRVSDGPITQASHGETPFGFAFSRAGDLIVSEAHGIGPNESSVSSYSVAADGTLSIVTASATTHQAAACWIAISKNSRYAYSTNAASGTISGFSIGEDGSLSLVTPDGRTGVTGPGSSPVDMSFSNNGRYLYSLNSGTHNISGFGENADGTLDSLGTFGSLPVGDTGLVAR